ncbi:hypothetical protein FW778_13880 [Ginsengibacter hankyongi]|uniref:Putative beta-lactamase-inhibitor-like PepSY-like domain-containing protein n=1 Tax=Ginsengibacter hankyongi TaxID=2607284 RepID=A0A5J5IIR2_9BACT|nr:PepSY-like domain-containing protein [Ginsengibacter hankyongi]KAA9038637.1 hypothetical protein FW778_13880 [Ginsengibacter hankyongi]
MKKIISAVAILLASTAFVFSQQHEGHKHIVVPRMVKTSLYKKYPAAKRVTWEKENGNYEANWGGKSGEANSVQFKPDGTFIEIVKEIPVNQLPELVIVYINKHYKEPKITEAGKVTDAQGNLFYEAEVKGRDVIFDKDGKFVKAE